MTKYTIHVDETEHDLDELILKMELGDNVMRSADNKTIYTAMVKTAVKNGDEWIENTKDLKQKKALLDNNRGGYK